VRTALQTSTAAVTILLAKGDNTAVTFRNAWNATADARIPIEERDTASHSFATVADKEWLFERVRAAIAQAH
jgi:hypothetical protein